MTMQLEEIKEVDDADSQESETEESKEQNIPLQRNYSDEGTLGQDHGSKL